MKYYLTSRIAERMDQDLREKVHNKLAPCTDDEFMNECCKLDPHFSSLIGEVLMEDGAVNSLVSMISQYPIWEPDYLRDLCELVGGDYDQFETFGELADWLEEFRGIDVYTGKVVQ